MYDEGKIDEIYEAVNTRPSDCDGKNAKKNMFTIIGHTPQMDDVIYCGKNYIDIDGGVSYEDGKLTMVNLTTGDIKYYNHNDLIRETKKEKQVEKEEEK